MISARQVALRVFLPFAASVLLSYFFRSVNAVLESYLRADVPGVDRTAIGVITGAFFLAVATFQLPLGILLDRFGPRRVQATLMLLAAAGCVVFALADGVVALFLGRALVGLGMAAGLMAALNAFALWYSSDDLPAVNGWAMAVGSVGTILATLPVQWMLAYVDWRELFFALSIITLLLASTIFMVVPERSGHSLASSSGASTTGGLAQIWRSRVYWRLMPVFVVGQGTIVAVNTLWIAPWLLEVRGFSEDMKSAHLLLMAATQLVGLSMLGRCVRFLRGFGVTPVALAASSMLLGIGVLAAIALNPAFVPAWLLITLLSTGASGSTLFFAAITQKFPVALSGRLVTSLNMSVFAMVFAVQSFIGFLVNRLIEQAGFEAATAYGVTFLILSVVQIGPFLLFLLLRSAEEAA